MSSKIPAIPAAVFFGILSLLPAECSASKISDTLILSMVDDALQKLPDKIDKVPTNIRRVAFFSIRVDKDNITRSVFRQIQGKIESKFLEFDRPSIVYAPEVTPVKITATEGGVAYTTSFQTTKEIKETGQSLRLDGFLEGHICVTAAGVYLNLRIFDVETLSIVWSISLDSRQPEETPPRKMNGKDLIFGASGLYLSPTTSSGADDTIPDYAGYYTLAYRLSHYIHQNSRIAVTLTGQVYAMYKGIKSETIRDTICSSVSMKIPSIVYGAFTGVRIPIIQVKTAKGERERDWLASEIKFGKLWGAANTGNNIYGVRIESDVTTRLSIGAGVSFASTQEVRYSTAGSKVKTGGLMYDISFLQLNYRS